MSSLKHLFYLSPRKSLNMAVLLHKLVYTTTNHFNEIVLHLPFNSLQLHVTKRFSLMLYCYIYYYYPFYYCHHLVLLSLVTDWLCLIIVLFICSVIYWLSAVS